MQNLGDLFNMKWFYLFVLKVQFQLHCLKYQFHSKIFSKSAINLTGDSEHSTKTGTKLVVNVVSTYFLGLNQSKFNYVQLLLNDISSGIGNKINVKPVDKHLDE